ncbi:NAD(P)-dependent dehydrogenase (short-subunit alcohol dehydrogenase family) [Bosea sp. BE125]|uniref:SDR family oxidoreductase n=1 Tax=Bosea sp. BE125 TaxID=2817909 RepID=UPI002863EF8B|nr:SDR family oxidoreductase [Bosea sp. BE125]MDR6871649.1 NAD(P)-dependent dehydrogenase (short-subunit alcohol dehydrogenase family) [Bosea sp. BE125]
MIGAGETVVVIGGSSGIGLAVARLAASQGARVVIIGRDKTKLEAAVSTIGPSARGEIVDAQDRTALAAFFQRLGPFNHLILAASGGRGAGAFRELDGDGLRAGFEAKFWAQWNAAQAALPTLQPAGSMVFITAASSRLANPGTSGLAAVNGALERMVVTLARELAPIRINAVSPGVIDTGWWDDKAAGLFEASYGKAPLARPGQPDEVADAVLFLMANAFVTGVILDVDGGLHLT